MWRNSTTSCVVWTVDTADAVVWWHTYHKGVESIHPPYIQSLSAREVKKELCVHWKETRHCAKNVFLTFWTYFSLVELIFHCNQISANTSCINNNDQQWWLDAYSLYLFFHIVQFDRALNFSGLQFRYLKFHKRLWGVEGEICLKFQGWLSYWTTEIFWEDKIYFSLGLTIWNSITCSFSKRDETLEIMRSFFTRLLLDRYKLNQHWGKVCGLLHIMF